MKMSLAIFACCLFSTQIATAQNDKAKQRIANRTRMMNNMKYFGLAFHNYDSVYRHFPAQAIFSKDGKPLLSWRVAILPYIDELELYKQFKLDEPWDSDHNKKLISKMPKLYENPMHGKLQKEGMTSFLLAIGKTYYPTSEKGIRIRDYTDGTSNTVLVVERPASEAVTWTKPADWEVPKSDLLAAWKKTDRPSFAALLCDGSVHMLRTKLDEETMKALLTPAGGEVVDRSKLKK